MNKSTVRQSFAAALALAICAVLATGLLAFAHQATRERIAAAERAEELDKIAVLLPPEIYDNDPLADRIEVKDAELLGIDAALPVYRARLHGVPTAVVLRAVAPQGYSGAIDLLIGIRADGRLLGVRVTQHHETPGLGDAIEERKSDWIESFHDRSLNDPPPERWAVKKDGGDFDQFSGATITPRAVVLAVKRAQEFFAREREGLFSAAPVAD